tara:strand:+ start:16412 stop:16822 length:411 start_codon:yes stop_codon:yes gene_type:complete
MPSYNTLYHKQTKQYVWWTERDSIGIALMDPLTSVKNRFSSIDEVQTITIFYHKKADHFNTLDSASSAMTEQSELPTQFHQYIVDKTIQLGYELKPDEINKAMYFERKFEKGIKEGKAFKNRGRVTGMRSVIQHNF